MAKNTTYNTESKKCYEKAFNTLKELREEFHETRGQVYVPGLYDLINTLYTAEYWIGKRLDKMAK